jgi:DNA-binding CsgD family transcriptional regulator
MRASADSSGLAILGDLPWGSHLCQFFQTQRDLLDVLVPYFRAGLENREFCLWIIHAPLTAEVARKALSQRVPDAERYLADRSIEIVTSRQWYLRGKTFSLSRVVRAWDAKLAGALAAGYVGLRGNGNTAWLGRKQWRRFQEYEQAVNTSLTAKPMKLLCSYALQRSGAADVLDVARTHQFAVARREGEWAVLEWRNLPPSSDPFRTLTPREREVFLAAAGGLTSPQIAKRLGISVRTVESHRASFMRKLGLRNQTELVRYALQRVVMPIGGSSR